MNINTFNIDTSDMPSVETVRKFVVTGEFGAKFKIFALQNPSSSSNHTLYYDFKDKSFAAGHNDLHNDLIVTLGGSKYENEIVFPSGVGGYVIKLTPIGDTKVQNFASNIITKNISKQAAATTVTFTPKTRANTSNYATFPTTTSVGDINSSDKFTFDWDITNASTSAGGFGLRLTGDYKNINNKAWFFKTTDTVDFTRGGPIEILTNTVDGAISSSTSVTLDHNYDAIGATGILVGMYVYGTGVTNGTTIAAINVGDDPKDITLSAAMSISDGVTLTFVAKDKTVVVDDLTDIAVGMTIIGVSAGSLIGTPRIVSINTDTKLLALSSEQPFADGITLTFKATGMEMINDAIGLLLDFGGAEVTPTTLTKTVRADSDGDHTTSTTITLNNTLGLSGGDIISYKGVGVDNSSSNRITSVTEDHDGTGADGLIVVEKTQILRAKTILTFPDIFSAIKFKGSMKVLSYPSSDKTIYFDIDNYITVGTAS